MAQSKVMGLQGYFVRSLFIALLGAAAIALIFLLSFGLLLNYGVIAPANAGESTARIAMDELRETGTFSKDSEPLLFEYVQFDANGNVVFASNESELNEVLSRYSNRDTFYQTAAYLFLNDGTSYLLYWEFAARFIDPQLNAILPNAEATWLVLAIAGLLAYLLIYSARLSKRFRVPLETMEAASRQIADQNLDEPIDTSAGIREFDMTLQAIESMRSELKSSLVKLWQTEQKRRQEVAALAHDLKTPLTVVNGNVELLLEDALSSEQKDLLLQIHDAGGRVTQYVEALQEVSYMEMGITNEEATQISPERIVHELKSIIDVLAKKKDVNLLVSCVQPVQEISAYQTLLMRALLNICVNAIRFTPQGKTVEISVRQTDDTTSFLVQDEGEGFSEEALEHARDLFWQGDIGRSDKETFGIGLAVAEGVANKHKGSLTLSNTETGGCVVLSIAREL